MGLKVDSIRVDVDDSIILDGVSLDVASGTTVAVVGPSGVGKSTLLRVIAGILQPSKGTVTLDGLDITHVPAHRRNVGLVFQDDQLFAHLSVADNVAFGLDMKRPVLSRFLAPPKVRRARRAERSARIADMLSLVGLEAFGNRQPMTLSGGEAKRVALARALAPAPAVLLLDEPLTGLDRDLHDRLMHDLRVILRSTSTTAVLVTHDMAEAEYLADRIVALPKAGTPTDHRG